MDTIHQSANILSQVAFYTDKHDALCINFVRALTDQILNFGKNSNDNSLSLLKKTMAVMLFP